MVGTLFGLDTIILLICPRLLRLSFQSVWLTGVGWDGDECGGLDDGEECDDGIQSVGWLDGKRMSVVG